METLDLLHAVYDRLDLLVAVVGHSILLAVPVSSVYDTFSQSRYTEVIRHGRKDIAELKLNLKLRLKSYQFRKQRR